MLVVMSRKLKGVHVGFLIEFMNQNSIQQGDGAWRSVAAARIFLEAGTQTMGTYIDKRQAIVADWVVLRLILQISDRVAGYKVSRG